MGNPGGGAPLAGHVALSPPPPVLRSKAATPAVRSRSAKAVTPDSSGPPSTPYNPTFDPSTASLAESLAPTFYDTYSDPNGGSGYINFRILTASGTIILTGQGTTVPSAFPSSWTWADGTSTLQAGATYTVQAQAVSTTGDGSSAYTSGKTFTVDPRLGDGNHPWLTNVSVSPDSTTTARMDVANGELNVSVNALSLPGVNLPLDLNFNETSAQPNGSGEGSSRLGYNWVDTFTEHVSESPDILGVTYFDPTGGTAAFTAGGSGLNTWQSPGSVNATLAEQGPIGGAATGWTLTFHTADSSHAAGQVDTFDANGYLVKETNSTGESITIARNASEVPTSATDTQGRKVTFGYNGSSQLTTITDTASGKTVGLTYNSTQGVATVVDSNNGTTQFNYDPSGLDLTSIVSPAGRTTTFGYSADGYQVTSIQKATNLAWTFAYTPSTFSVSTYQPGTTAATDPNQAKTTYTWDEADRVTKTVDPLGQHRSTTWTTDSNVQNSVDPAGQDSFAYHQSTDTLASSADHTADQSQYTYSPSGNQYVPASVIDSQRNTRSYIYGSASAPYSPTKVTNQLGSQNTTSTV